MGKKPKGKGKDKGKGKKAAAAEEQAAQQAAEAAAKRKTAAQEEARRKAAEAEEEERRAKQEAERAAEAEAEAEGQPEPEPEAEGRVKEEGGGPQGAAGGGEDEAVDRAAAYEAMRPPQLKDECRRKGLSPQGLRDELIARLVGYGASPIMCMLYAAVALFASRWTLYACHAWLSADESEAAQPLSADESEAAEPGAEDDGFGEEGVPPRASDFAAPDGTVCGSSTPTPIRCSACVYVCAPCRTCRGLAD
jgi:hypothetical protein